MPPNIVLASSSTYRSLMLKHLGLDFTVEPPEIDETPYENEGPYDFCNRLSYEKASKVAQNHPSDYVIGCDQAAYCNGKYLSKPGNFETNLEYLLHSQGKVINFFTGLCLLNLEKKVCLQTSKLVTAHVKKLQPQLIKDYIRMDKPYDCAGGIRIEKKGIALLEKLESDDPTAIMGMPLITLIGFLEQCGIYAHSTI
ncbi:MULTISPECIES: Maf family protein [Candidatus Ichthyocystis]|uniref:Maf family protein n=1 Tax=Candidatus Ichthyocystis TaxID=2929841 RepID=UPI000B806B7B|nr:MULTISPECIES: Maf family nucleotide pyrophosphatase [Ichthyocystis]